MKHETQALVRSRFLGIASVSDYFTLTKPRISLMVTLTAAVGYFMASRGVGAAGLLHTLVGTFLVSGAANTLNQVLERTPDAIMTRTSRRPIPRGSVSPERAVAFATILGVGGIVYCAIALNLLTAAIAAVTLGSYVFVYTPLKRKTSLNTLVGAVPGALPPLGGWAAATGRLDPVGWALFGIVFFWQIPHFLSIAWLLRQDYAKAGFKMLPIVVDPMGSLTARHIMITGLILIPVSLLPWFLGAAGTTYLVGAAALSAIYAGFGLRTLTGFTTRKTRALFLVSLLYLPAILGLLMADKLPVGS